MEAFGSACPHATNRMKLPVSHSWCHHQGYHVQLLLCSRRIFRGDFQTPKKCI